MEAQIPETRANGPTWRATARAVDRRSVKEYRPRVEWWGRVRGADGRKRWVKAADLRRAESE
jgi:hypothetical protein